MREFLLNVLEGRLCGVVLPLLLLQSMGGATVVLRKRSFESVVAVFILITVIIVIEVIINLVGVGHGLGPADGVSGAEAGTPLLDLAPLSRQGSAPLGQQWSRSHGLIVVGNSASNT